MVRQTGKYLAAADDGTLSNEPIFTATSPTDGEKVEFKSYAAASWWIWLITEERDQREYRLGL